MVAKGLPHHFSIDGQCALGDRTPAIALNHLSASSCFIRTGQGARRRLANAIRQRSDVAHGEIAFFGQLNLAIGWYVASQNRETRDRRLEQNHGQPFVTGRQHEQTRVGV